MLGMDAQQRPSAIRERVGVLPEGYGFDDPLTGREYLAWTISTKEADDDPDELLELVGVADDSERMAGDYSKGMQRRLAFAIALAADPDLLVLDEPSTGLDPNGIRQMREVVRERADEGTTVFFSSHILSEVEAVCDRVGVMNAGELVAVDTIDGLRGNAGGHATGLRAAAGADQHRRRAAAGRGPPAGGRTHRDGRVRGRGARVVGEPVRNRAPATTDCPLRRSRGDSRDAATDGVEYPPATGGDCLRRGGRRHRWLSAGVAAAERRVSEETTQPSSRSMTSFMSAAASTDSLMFSRRRTSAAEAS